VREGYQKKKEQTPIYDSKGAAGAPQQTALGGNALDSRGGKENIGKEGRGGKSRSTGKGEIRKDNMIFDKGEENSSAAGTYIIRALE